MFANAPWGILFSPLFFQKNKKYFKLQPGKTSCAAAGLVNLQYMIDSEKVTGKTKICHAILQRKF